MFNTHLISRRTLLSGIAASLAAPAIAQSDPWQAIADRAAAFDQCHAILIRQAGETRLSAVFRGPEMGRLVPIKSVSKTVVAALTGAAIDRGELSSVTDRLGDVAPQLIPSDADPRVSQITIEDLVTMQAGLERTSGRNYGGWVSSRNWVANALARPIIAEPGTGMQYSTGSFHILGAVLSEVSGQSLLDLARERLGNPLGIEIPAWTRDPQGRYLGGNEMALTLEGMVRFGELYRLNGAFDGVRVLSQSWVTRSLEPRTRSPFSGLDYGYGWFLGQADEIPYALARGYGGQIICVAPQIGLTCAITSDPTRPARSGGYFGDLKRLIEQDILPAAREEA
ncbi:serine hydrolase domain-containing protein [Yoonia litorea]|uniref:CubicO group peptidase, beta-lactamase class C family n=1 Tax=Yoonia litorea TaxID=1123755 RepID=A0A1I6LAU3_9RHOB|nr:serine hydrolase [Yoonia litorea]SFS00603.1 CubicO group peptidase, beta-lactamase class C family [Yoonia litorea]